jgi:conjugative relaxase-like TrwC/TraI family protein
VAETMQEMEKEIQTRVRSKGRDEDRVVGNMAWAEFIHLTARPVGGVIDPHLHAHCFIFNAVFDPVEHKWKAGQFRELKANAPRFEQAFHARFAWKLMELGYPIERKGKRWEVAGIERDTLAKFSRRTGQIEEYARTHGIDDPAEKDGLGARLRSRKRSDAGMDQLRREWRDRLTDRERESFGLAALRRGFTADTPLPFNPPGLAGRQHPQARMRFLAAHHRQRIAAELAGEAMHGRLSP